MAFRALALRQSVIRSDEGLTLETPSLLLVTVANLHFQLSWYNQITLLPPPTQHHSFFRNFHPLFISPWITYLKTQPVHHDFGPPTYRPISSTRWILLKLLCSFPSSSSCFRTALETSRHFSTAIFFNQCFHQWVLRTSHSHISL